MPQLWYLEPECDRGLREHGDPFVYWSLEARDGSVLAAGLDETEATTLWVALHTMAGIRVP